MKKGWEIRPLGQIADIYNGNTISDRDKKERFSRKNRGRNFIATKDVGFDGAINYRTEVVIPAGNERDFKIAPVGATLVCAEGGSAGRKVGLLNEAVHFGNKLFAICPQEYVEPSYVFYFGQTDAFVSQFRARLTGLIGGVSLNKFREIEIPLPPLPEQKRIVEVLDKAFEGLATAKANAEANLQNARELFESFLESSFAEITRCSRCATLDEITENLDRQRVPITQRDRKAGEIPYYGASGIVDHVADYLFDEDLLLVSEDGANLLVRTYPIAFSISGKSWVNNHAHVLRFRERATQEYLRLYLNAISLEPYVSGMAQPKLNQAALNRIPVPLPELRAREELVKKAEEFSAETTLLEDHYERSVRSLEELKQSLLQKAFAGELT